MTAKVLFSRFDEIQARVDALPKDVALRYIMGDVLTDKALDVLARAKSYALAARLTAHLHATNYIDDLRQNAPKLFDAHADVDEVTTIRLGYDLAIGEFYRRLRRFDEAIAIYYDALVRADDITANFIRPSLAFACARRGMITAAREELDKCAFVADRAEHELTRGEIALFAGDFKEAERRFWNAYHAAKNANSAHRAAYAQVRLFKVYKVTWNELGRTYAYDLAQTLSVACGATYLLDELAEIVAWKRKREKSA